MIDTRFAKLVVFINCAVPAALLGWDAYRGNLGADPVNHAIHTTGMLALICLLLCLSITPLRKVTGLNWLISFRKMLGLYAFFYGCLHFLTFFIFDQSMNVPDTLNEMWFRKYLVIGALALLSMAPLAATSTNASIKRLGGKNWRMLHRLIYLTAVLAVVHYYMQVKSDIRQPLVFVGIVVVLLGFRVVVVVSRLIAEST